MKRPNTARLAAIACALLILAQPDTRACTGIRLRTKDGSFVHGRTLEFGVEVDTSIAVTPRGFAFVGKTPDGEGMNYTTRYAMIGITTYTDTNILDGMNEKGLSVGAFYFPTVAKYTPLTDENRSRALSPADFNNWILARFATTAEVRKAIEHGTVVITPTVIKAWGPVAPPFHYVVYDKSGASIAIEPIGGKLVVHDNPLGVMTNSPSFDWHMTNLRNYIALSPRNVPPIKIDSKVFKGLGQGSGMLGLPGDFTPPSRFVRAAVYSATAIPSKNAGKGIEQAFHILNNFDIPVGVARAEAEGVVHSDYTQITVARDPQSLRYYYKTYNDQTIRMVRLKQFDLDAKKIRFLSTKSTQPIVDMTDKVK